MAKEKKVVSDLPEICRLQTMCEAGIVDVPYSTIRNWCLRGIFPHAWRQGRFWYLRPAQFMEWFQGRENRQAS